MGNIRYGENVFYRYVLPFIGAEIRKDVHERVYYWNIQNRILPKLTTFDFSIRDHYNVSFIFNQI